MENQEIGVEKNWVFDIGSLGARKILKIDSWYSYQYRVLSDSFFILI